MFKFTSDDVGRQLINRVTTNEVLLTQVRVSSTEFKSREFIQSFDEFAVLPTDAIPLSILRHPGNSQDGSGQTPNEPDGFQFTGFEPIVDVREVGQDLFE